jgi:hypothetical protein
MSIVQRFVLGLVAGCLVFPASRAQAPGETLRPLDGPALERKVLRQADPAANAKAREQALGPVRLSRDVQALLARVCKGSARCLQEGPGDWLVADLLRQPTLNDGVDRRLAAKVAATADPYQRLELLVPWAMRRVAERESRGRASRETFTRAVGEQLLTEYRSGIWSTLPDTAWALAEATPTPGALAERITITHFAAEVLDSSPSQPTYQLGLQRALDDGPATHYRLWCDGCGSFSEDGYWRPDAEWPSMVIATGAVSFDVCMEVRAEPVFQNFANTDIACAHIGPPPVESPEPEPDENLSAASNPVQRCFGAIGNHCGAADGFDFGFCLREHPFTEPDVATCYINAGSWEHDECCIAKRVGGPAPAAEQGSCSPNQAALRNEPWVCSAEFNKAVAHFTLGFTWVRQVDASIENTSGQVDFAAYCAPTGSILATGDADTYCCSRASQPYVQHLGDAVLDARRVCL